MKISPLRRQEAPSIKILQGLVAPDGVEHVVTVGSGLGGSTALEREGPKPRAARIIVASRDGGVELPRRAVRPRDVGGTTGRACSRHPSQHCPWPSSRIRGPRLDGALGATTHHARRADDETLWSSAPTHGGQHPCSSPRLGSDK